MRILVTGATGLVGQGVLQACLQSADVSHVAALGRRASGQADPKLEEIIVHDLADLRAEENRLRRDFSRMTGSLTELYGLANLDALSSKRQRILPARCRVYDLLNFASEVATHHALPASRRSLQAFIGSLISDEYDMEGTAATGTEFADFFVASDQNGPRPSVN